MFDHVKFGVSDYAASKAFFLKALEPLGVVVGSAGSPTYGVELCTEDKASLCLFQTDEKPAHLHLAFTAENRQQVTAFYRPALEAGGKDNGASGLRPHYHAKGKSMEKILRRQVLASTRPIRGRCPCRRQQVIHRRNGNHLARGPRQRGVSRHQSVGLQPGQGDVLRHEGVIPAQFVGNLPGHLLQHAVAQQANLQRSQVVEAAVRLLPGQVAASHFDIELRQNL
jgi:hypothetical protein